MSHDNARDLATRPVHKLILKFAIPSIVSMLVMSLYNIVDQLFIGHGVGYLGNAATNIVFPVNVLTIAVSMLIGEGATARYSIKLGERDLEGARKTIGNAVLMLSLIGVLFATVCLLALKPLLGFLGATPQIMPYAVDYAGPIVWGVPFVVVGGGLTAMTRASGRPGYAMLAMMSGAVLNTILDPIFIFTLGMGVKGAAIATAISQAVSFLVIVRHLLRKDGGFGLRRDHFRPCASTVGKIMACGLAPSASQLAIMVIIILMNKSLVQYGALSKYGAEICLAAHGITMKVNQILFSVLIGISIGSQPIIGFNFGARDFGRVKKTFLISAVAATAVGVVAFAVFFTFPQHILNLFGTESALYNEFGQKCFRVFLFFTALNGFTVLAGTFFQSMAKVGRAATIQLSRQVLFMIPAVHFLPQIWGIDGVLLAGPCTDLLSFVLAMILVCREFKHMGEAAETEEKGAADLAGAVEQALEGAAAESTRASARLA